MIGKIFSIYKATNLINEKCYIGFDSNWNKPCNRKYEHEKNAFCETKKDFNCLFHKAIRKYGVNNFSWEIVYQSLDGIYCFKYMEPYFIDYFNSYKNGYNMTKGGDGTLGLKWTIKSKNKLRQNVSGPKNPNYGRRGALWSYTWIVWNISKEIIILQNLNKFCKENGLSIAAMSQVALGKRKHHKNWKCKILNKGLKNGCCD